MGRGENNLLYQEPLPPERNSSNESILGAQNATSALSRNETSLDETLEAISYFISDIAGKSKLTLNGNELLKTMLSMLPLSGKNDKTFPLEFYFKDFNNDDVNEFFKSKMKSYDSEDQFNLMLSVPKGARGKEWKSSMTEAINRYARTISNDSNINNWLSSYKEYFIPKHVPYFKREEKEFHFMINEESNETACGIKSKDLEKILLSDFAKSNKSDFCKKCYSFCQDSDNDEEYIKPHEYSSPVKDDPFVSLYNSLNHGYAIHSFPTSSYVSLGLQSVEASDPLPKGMTSMFCEYKEHFPEYVDRTEDRNNIKLTNLINIYLKNASINGTNNTLEVWLAPDDDGFKHSYNKKEISESYILRQVEFLNNITDETLGKEKIKDILSNATDENGFLKRTDFRSILNRLSKLENSFHLLKTTKQDSVAGSIKASITETIKKELTLLKA